MSDITRRGLFGVIGGAVAWLSGAKPLPKSQGGLVAPPSIAKAIENAPDVVWGTPRVIKIGYRPLGRYVRICGAKLKDIDFEHFNPADVRLEYSNDNENWHDKEEFMMLYGDGSAPPTDTVHAVTCGGVHL